jgi:quercetin dioxygenase-like cupin family protein
VADGVTDYEWTYEMNGPSDLRRLAITQVGEGEPLQIGTDTKLAGRSEWSGGAYCVMDQLVAPRSLVAAHSHELEDQAVWVLSGTLTLWVDGEQAAVAAGGFALRPAGLAHSMWNATADPVRILEITNPGENFQRYMRTLSELNARGEATPATVAELASANGISFFPELTNELAARTGLSTAGGFWKEP